VLEGVGDDELNAGPGHLPESVLPGISGNAVISAHRDRHFHRLDELQLGDTIRTETGHSSGLWVIVGRRVVGRDAPALFTANEPMLTLTTCWPVRYFGSAPDRLILSAKPVTGTWVGSSSRQRGRT
jgi:sortase A